MDHSPTYLDYLYRWAYRFAYATLSVYWKSFHPRSEGAFVAFWQDGRLLVVKHSYKPGYSLPGGGVDRGEAHVDAAVRELREEIGIEIEPVSLSKPLEVHLTEEGKDDYVSCFECFYEEGQPDLRIDNREIIWAAFVEPEALAREQCNPLLQFYLGRQPALNL